MRFRRVSVRNGKRFVGLCSDKGLLLGVMSKYYSGIIVRPVCRILFWRRTLWLFGKPILSWKRDSRWIFLAKRPWLRWNENREYGRKIVTPSKIDMRNYLSDRVFDGTRKITDPNEAAEMLRRIERDIAKTNITDMSVVINEMMKTNLETGVTEK